MIFAVYSKMCLVLLLLFLEDKTGKCRFHYVNRDNMRNVVDVDWNYSPSVRL